MEQTNRRFLAVQQSKIAKALSTRMPIARSTFGRTPPFLHEGSWGDANGVLQKWQNPVINV
ncbi:hypothetical protein O4G73_03120 [Erythrobacter sp. G21629-S1]|jgi:hypothetical protein|nr:hypothetical protein [Erythrobacter sp. G21629-S1]